MSALSQARLDANIGNAQLSTGPRTEAGKQRSSQNAVSHAIFAKTIPARDHAAYQALLAQFKKDMAPKGAVEEQLTQTLADAQWRLNRCRELQAALLFADTETPDRQLDALNKYSLYENRLTRLMQTALNQLREIQSDRYYNEEKGMREAEFIAKSMAAKGKDYDPTEDGFEFSAGELAVWMRRSDRAQQARNTRFFDMQNQKSVW